MKQTHTRRDKGRAVFLAALMVLSVFAMSAAFAGGAAAAADGVTVSTDTVNLLNEEPETIDAEVSHETADAEVAVAIANEDGEVVYSAEAATDGSESTTFTDIDVSDEDEGDYTVYGEAGADVTAPTEGEDVGEFGDDGATATLSLIAQVTVGNLGDQDDIYQGQTIEVDGFDGNEYVLINEGTLSNNDRVDQEQAENGVATIDTSDLEAGTYVLVGDESGTEAGPFEVVNQDISMEFADDSVAQTNTELTYESENRDEAVDLEISSEQLDGEELEEIFGVDNADDGVITVENVEEDGSINANFSDVETGEYDFTASVADTTAEADASIEVTEAGEPNAEFDQSTYSEAAGDIVEFTIDMEHTEEAQIELIEEDDNYNVTLDVTDGDGDGEVTVRFNTYLAGEDDDAAFSTADEDDSVDVNVTNDETGDARLLPADFDLELDVDGEETDVAALFLTEGSINDAATGVAPSDADLDDVEDISNATTESGEVAEGDRLVFAFDASGVFGAIDEDELEDHFDLMLQQTNDQYDNGQSLSEYGSYEIVEDPENDRFFVVLDTDEMEAGDEYELTLEPNEDREIPSLSFIDDEDYKKGSNVIVSTGFNVVERTIEISGDFDKNDRLLVPNSEEATIHGHSNAAPGTDVQVHLRATGEDPFLMSQTVQVDDDGSVNADFDLSEHEHGQEFTVRMTDRNADDLQDRVDAILTKGDKVDDGEKDENNGDDNNNDDNQNDNNDDNQNDNNDNNDDEQPGSGADDDQPGFGIIVALVALLAAAGFALRRQ